MLCMIRHTFTKVYKPAIAVTYLIIQETPSYYKSITYNEKIKKKNTKILN